MNFILAFVTVFTSCAYGGGTQQWRGVLINGAAGTQVYSRLDLGRMNFILKINFSPIFFRLILLEFMRPIYLSSVGHTVGHRQYPVRHAGTV
jgi:hypothetical protein